MMRTLRFIAGLLVTMGIVLGVSILSLQPAGAVVPVDGGGGGGGSSGGSTPSTSASAAQEAACLGSGGNWAAGKCTTPGDSRTVMGTIRSITDILVFVIGAVAVLMIIVGGFRYTLAQGDSSAINNAKNTILYAIVGLLIASAAYGLVHFVLINVK